MLFCVGCCVLVAGEGGYRGRGRRGVSLLAWQPLLCIAEKVHSLEGHAVSFIRC
jgi:hypothetical protein